MKGHSHPTYKLVGSIAWILSIQYFIFQVITALSWSNTYSIAHNTISDLGNTTCGSEHSRFVCSPLHTWMNLSFILLGAGMIVGSILLRKAFRKSAFGFMCMTLAGIGTALVGFFPENTNSTLHTLGAALPFVIGNISLIIFGQTLAMPPALRAYTIGSGILALGALILFICHIYLGIGIGGMERITAYPQTVWLVVFGIYTLIKALPTRP